MPTVLVKVGDRVAGGATRDCATCRKRMSDQNPKIYLLPNLMTAGNLFCGFAATLKIVQGALLQASDPDAAADAFSRRDLVSFSAPASSILLDGRLARLGGQDSAIRSRVRFAGGHCLVRVAPALMVYRIVLVDFPRAGWVIAFRLSGLRHAASGALQLHRRERTSTRRKQEFHRLSDSGRRRPDRVDHACLCSGGSAKASTRSADGSGSCRR